MDPDSLFFGRALRRLCWMIAVLGFAGAASAAVYGGWQWAAGFVLGAAASISIFAGSRNS